MRPVPANLAYRNVVGYEMYRAKEKKAMMRI
jgi:hypothetical protein